MELAVTMSIVAVGFALFGLAVRYLPVFPQEETAASSSTAETPDLPTARPLFGKGVLLALWGLLAVGVGATAFSMERSGHAPASEPTPMEPRSRSVVVDLSLPDPYVFPASEESPGAVTFDHASHVDTDAPDCGVCHRTLFAINEPGITIQGSWSYERIHEGDLCASCHDGQDAFSVEDDCTICHRM
jgi:c(7)-type cytochrome triheme protein